VITLFLQMWLLSIVSSALFIFFSDDVSVFSCTYVLQVLCQK
jgi:hypothetical protein